MLQSKKEEIRAKAVEILGYSMLQESLQYRIFPALLKTRHDRSPAVRQAFVKGIVALHHQSQNQEKF
ncbi:MAG: hypothetical protein HWD59_03725 [Coxiellaceae bacterium]|nr:MAG: hypothetical protein HWD59_03725 [Coxiellaceae bacterium]